LALKDLQNYLYVDIGIEIQTDHQSLSYKISGKNPSEELKRWYLFIKSYSPKIINKPGITNVVADALSRAQVNNISNIDLDLYKQSNADQDTQYSAESSFENLIQEIRKPLNKFKHQILSRTEGIHELLEVFDKTRHIFEYDTVENLVTILKEYTSPNITVRIHCSLEDLYHIHVSLHNSFTNKFVFMRIFLQDNITDTQLKFQLEKPQYQLKKENIYPLIYTMRKV